MKKLRKHYEAFCLKKGEKLWRRFCDTAPAAVGVFEDDEPRLILFKDYLNKISSRQRVWLKKFLESQLHFFRYGGLEGPSCATEELHDLKWSQIYRTHLECFD